MLPNFYIAGGARCGSTSLFAYCKAHPQIFMAQIKEPNFFSYGYGKVPFAGPDPRHIYDTSIKDLETYRAMFKVTDNALAVGEASINYMLHPEACLGIRTMTPEAKLIFSLRQPVDRAWSSFQRSRHEGSETEPDFLTAWRDDDRRRAAGRWSNIHRYKSLYGRHLKIWFETFPREQIKVILFDDLKADPKMVMRDVFSFLGIDPNFEPDTSVVHNQSGEIGNPVLKSLWLGTAGLRAALVPLMPLKWRGRLFPMIARNQNVKRPKEKLGRELKEMLTAELREDILSLQDLIGRDLSMWLTPKG